MNRLNPTDGRQSHAPTAARPGFTLVELLVVIGIIAVLISILLPSLGRIRDQAAATKCLANMKQIGTAFTMYVNDNKGAMPFVVPDNFWKPWSARFYGSDPAPTATAPAAHQVNNVHRHLMKYLGGSVRNQPPQTNGNLVTLNSQIYRCPSAVDFVFSVDYRPFEFSNTNYTFNGVMMRRKTTDIRKSAAFIIASEGRYAWSVSAMRPYPVISATAWPTADLSTIEYRQWIWHESGNTAGFNRILNLTLHRKNEAGNVLYLDGHAATVDFRDVRAADYGLTDSANPGQGLERDTYAQILADPIRTYRAKLR